MCILTVLPVPFPSSPWPTFWIFKAQLGGHFLYQVFLDLETYCAIDHILSWSNISNRAPMIHFLPLFIFDCVSLHLGFKIWRQEWGCIYACISSTQYYTKCSIHESSWILCRNKTFLLISEFTWKKKFLNQNLFSLTTILLYLFYLNFWYCFHFPNICSQGFSKSLIGSK